VHTVSRAKLSHRGRLSESREWIKKFLSLDLKTDRVAGWTVCDSKFQRDGAEDWKPRLDKSVLVNGWTSSRIWQMNVKLSLAAEMFRDSVNKLTNSFTVEIRNELWKKLELNLPTSSKYITVLPCENWVHHCITSLQSYSNQNDAHSYSNGYQVCYPVVHMSMRINLQHVFKMPSISKYACISCGRRWSSGILTMRISMQFSLTCHNGSHQHA